MDSRNLAGGLFISCLLCIGVGLWQGMASWIVVPVVIIIGGHTLRFCFENRLDIFYSWMEWVGGLLMIPLDFIQNMISRTAGAQPKKPEDTVGKSSDLSQPSET